MSYRRLIRVAQEQFQGLSLDQNVLILHPQFLHHTLLVDALLDIVACEVLLVTLPGSAATLKDFWGALAHELDSVFDIRLPPFEGSPEAAVEQFCGAVLPLRPLLIVVNAYDAGDDTVDEFVSLAARRLTGQCRFVLSGRVWPTRLVKRCVPGTIRILPAAPDDLLLDYLQNSSHKIFLEVRALGSGQVFIDGRHVNQWDGVLPRALFFYLVDRGMTTRDEVFNTFWPELTTREATNVFHVTKRKISEILGVDLTVYSSGFYRISPQIELSYDVVAFAEAVQNSAVYEGADAQALLERAILLHSRAFLNGFEQPWAARRREELVKTYAEALSSLAQMCETQHRIQDALGLYVRAFSTLPQREDLARSLMRLYRQDGCPDRALQVYRRLVDELQRSLGVTPSPETIALADEIRAEVGG